MPPDGDKTPGAGDQGPLTTSVARADALSESPTQSTRQAPGSGPPRRRAFSPGDVVSNRYQIVRFIAQGGMGEVYEARDLELEGRVALKTVRPDIADQETSFARFKREIHIARKVTHPNVCRIFDLGRHKVATEGDEFQVVYLTMELLEGETLSARLKRTGRMRPEQAQPLIRQMASALATAHDAGVVHRDFKSSNVILVPGKSGERAVVTDFGLARAGLDAASAASITGSGDMVGTPAYMAPEQIEGKAVGPAVDIYALGVVMYEMATGVLPFHADTPIAVAVKRLKESPTPPRSLVQDLDARWEAVILRCLERDPSQRFASPADVVRALGGEAVVPSLRSRRRLMAGVTLAIIAALGAGYYLSSVAPRGGPTSQPPPTAAPVKARRSLAVLGFKNLGRRDADWLSTAVSEMLRTELAVGEQFRTIPGENVARMKVELALTDADSLALDTLARIRANLGADLVVLGSYLVTPDGRTRLDLRLQDTRSGELLVSASAVGTQSEIFDLVSNAGAQLRPRLGLAEVSQAEAAGIRATLPSHPQAARLYAEGLAKLRVFDAQAARDLIEKAAALEPTHALVHAALATAWSGLGYGEKARAKAQRAFELSKALPREERLSVEGLLRETTGEWDKAVGIYRGLAVFFPDNAEYGLHLAAAQTAAGRGQDALETVEGLRRLPPPAAEDPRLDLAEAAAAKAVTDFARQQRAAAQAAAKARTQGARHLLAQARLTECSALVNLAPFDAARAACEEARELFSAVGDRAGTARAESLLGVRQAMDDQLPEARARFERALEVFQQIGDKGGAAAQLGNVGNVLDLLGDRAGARKAYEASLKISREIGDKSNLAKQLNNLATLLENTGELDGARRTYEEALRAFEEMGEKRNVALAMSNVGEILEKQGRAGAAARQYEASLALTREIDARVETAGTLRLLARLRSKRNDREGAVKALEEALALYRELSDKEGEAEAQRELGEITRR